jgi:hypothetical protein
MSYEIYNQSNKPIITNHQSYIIIHNAISREICDLIASYANFKASISPNIKKDAIENTHREYGDLMMDMLLDRLTPLVEKATKLELWPTLSFYYAYKNGAKLAKHKDRSSCQIVAGLCIDADDDFRSANEKWPLILNIDGKAEPIALDYGDMVIFKGHETEHWREAFTGKWFVSAIFGYVDKTGPFAFQKFDQRKSLGKNHVGMFHWSYGCIKNKIATKVKSYLKAE